MNRSKIYFPFHDETAFNICLWKHNAKESLGYIFVNTHVFDTVKLVEETDIRNQRLGKNIDEMGADWEYIRDSSQIMFYHGFKAPEHTLPTLNYLINV